MFAFGSAFGWKSCPVLGIKGGDEEHERDEQGGNGHGEAKGTRMGGNYAHQPRKESRAEAGDGEEDAGDAGLR